MGGLERRRCTAAGPTTDLARAILAWAPAVGNRLLTRLAAMYLYEQMAPFAKGAAVSARRCRVTGDLIAAQEPQT